MEAVRDSLGSKYILGAMFLSGHHATAGGEHCLSYRRNMMTARIRKAAYEGHLKDITVFRNPRPIHFGFRCILKFAPQVVRRARTCADAAKVLHIFCWLRLLFPRFCNTAINDSAVIDQSKKNQLTAEPAGYASGGVSSIPPTGFVLGVFAVRRAKNREGGLCQ